MFMAHSTTRGHMDIRGLESGLCLRVESLPGPCRSECPALPPRATVLPGPGPLQGAISGVHGLAASVISADVCVSSYH